MGAFGLAVSAITFNPRVLAVFRPVARVFGLQTGWEWVQDVYAAFNLQAPVDGTAVETANCAARVVRGGSWSGTPDFLRSAYRYWGYPLRRDIDFGFRLAQN